MRTLDVGDHADIVLGGEDELVVAGPLGFVLQDRAGVQRHNLEQTGKHTINSIRTERAHYSSSVVRVLFVLAV